MSQTAHFRALPRREMSLPATLSWSDGEPNHARLCDVGLGGACLELHEAPSVGQDVVLSVTTPVLWDPLVVRAEVAWVEGGEAGPVRVGLRFDHSRSRAIHALFQLLGADEFE